MSVESAVRGVIEDVPQDELDEKMKKHIAELRKCILFTVSFFTALIIMQRTCCRDTDDIVEIMTQLKIKPVWRRFLRKESTIASAQRHESTERGRDRRSVWFRQSVFRIRRG